MFDWFIPRDIGGTAAVADLLISAAGVTAALLAKSAAEQAMIAARDARERVRKFETVVDFSAAIAALEEIKRLHREEAWPVLPDRYMAVRKLLVQLRHSGVSLTPEQSTVIQRALTHLVETDRQVEKSLSDNSVLKANKLNALISDDLDGLVTVLTQIKNQTTGDLL